MASFGASQANPTAIAIAHGQTGVLMALFSLVKSLEENGALKPGQYESKLRATVMQPGAEQPSYQFVAALANALDDAGDEATPR